MQTQACVDMKEPTQGATPLFMAAFHGQPGGVEYLVKGEGTLTGQGRTGLAQGLGDLRSEVRFREGLGLGALMHQHLTCGQRGNFFLRLVTLNSRVRSGRKLERGSVGWCHTPIHRIPRGSH